jgi:hypothetical protein
MAVITSANACIWMKNRFASDRNFKGCFGGLRPIPLRLQNEAFRSERMQAMKWMLIIFIVGGTGVNIEKVPFPTEAGCKKAVARLEADQEQRVKIAEPFRKPINVQMIGSVGISGSCLKIE